MCSVTATNRVIFQRRPLGWMPWCTRTVTGRTRTRRSGLSESIPRKPAPARLSLVCLVRSELSRFLRGSCDSCHSFWQGPICFGASPQLLSSVQHLCRTHTKQASTNHSEDRRHPDSSQVALGCFMCINDVRRKISTLG